MEDCRFRVMDKCMCEESSQVFCMGKCACFEEEVTTEENGQEFAPVIHAKWVPCNDGFGCRCSNCLTGKSQLINEFCAKCGARMDGE